MRLILLVHEIDKLLITIIIIVEIIKIQIKIKIKILEVFRLDYLFIPPLSSSINRAKNF